MIVRMRARPTALRSRPACRKRGRDRHASTATAPMRRRCGGVAADAHVHVYATVAHLRLQPHVGGHLVEVQGPAAIDRRRTPWARAWSEHAADESARRNSAASAPASNTSPPDRDRQARRTTPAAASAPAGPRRLIMAANRSAERSVRPRIWMLPRDVISMTPLPSRALPRKRRERLGDGSWLRVGVSRTSRPSPVGIGVATGPGRRHARKRRVHRAASA